jgi:hypothetical protein
MNGVRSQERGPRLIGRSRAVAAPSIACARLAQKLDVAGRRTLGPSLLIAPQVGGVVAR